MGIYWLASYPKSGNTWLRAFLTNYRSPGSSPAAINALDGQWTASSRECFDELTGLDSSLLTPAQVSYYRPRVYEQLALRSPVPLFLKLHDAYTRNSAGEGLFPARATAGAIYIVRNPLDVAVSYAHHQAKPLDDIIREMSDDRAAITVSSQLPQFLSSWSGHIESWTTVSELPLHVVRYEDMLAHPHRAFGSIVQFAGLPEDDARLDVAIAHSSFEALRDQEQRHGFREKTASSSSFFRAGKSGTWRDHLDQVQVRRLIERHHRMMLRFGYLSPANELLV